MNAKNLKFSTVVCLAFVVFSAVYFTQSIRYEYWHGYGPGAGFVPMWCSGLMLFLSIISFIQSIKGEGVKLSEAFPKGAGRGNIVVTCLALVFFTAFAKILGFMVTNIVMLSILFGRSLKWKRAVIYSVILVVSCYVLFSVILQVPVPVNSLGW